MNVCLLGDLSWKSGKKIAGLSYSGYSGGKKNEKVPGWSVPACVAGCG